MVDCSQTQIGVAVPWPLDARLDALVERAQRYGRPTNRKELLAALILDAPNDPAALGALVDRYRRSKAGHAVPSGDDAEAFLRQREKRPGPRPRRPGPH